MGTYVQTQHDDHDDVEGRGPIDIVHDQQLLVGEVRAFAAVGLTRRFSASLMVPVRVVDTSIRYLDRAGAEVMLARPDLHHRNEVVSGIADPMLLGSASLTAGAWRVTARAGITIPIGRTEENPFALGDLGLRHQHIQLGTGTVNPVVAAEAARAWGMWRFGTYALSQQVVYDNAKGYRAGDRYAAGVALQRRLGAAWSVRGGIDALGESPERWGGAVPTDDGNRGRFDLIFGAGATWAASRRVGIDLAVKVPAITHAVGGQLAIPAIVEVGASWSFGGKRAAAGHHHDDDHDDDHDHGHGHDRVVEHVDAAGLDVADVGRPGEAVELVPVPGKLTIFDFWAAWCEPCKKLEPALVELARAHPQLVAIRRIDAADWDSAAVAQHLTPKGFGLPHVKVFDGRGVLVLERSSDASGLDKLIADIRALVPAK
ncbi:MAG: thioredoxin family protein [Deltaproteobacteria bacterium]|nr:thioredoxin family protein [Deltaproteobacteria bacterium]